MNNQHLREHAMEHASSSGSSYNLTSNDRKEIRGAHGILEGDIDRDPGFSFHDRDPGFRLRGRDAGFEGRDDLVSESSGRGGSHDLTR